MPLPALKARPVRYSSVVGSSVMLTSPDGRMVAQLMVMLPGMDADGATRREAMIEIAQRTADLWNGAGPAQNDVSDTHGA